MKIIELFSGLGSPTQALKNIGVKHEVVAISEIDTYANIAYEALHGKVNNLGDISKIAELPAADLWFYGFCCQDISNAGKQAGLAEGSGTRSSLLWEVKRLLLKAQQNGSLPKYLAMENVKALVGKKFKEYFDIWLDVLSDLGYNNYWKVLNAKDYEIPQNRERVFCVSIMGKHNPFEFPKSIKLATTVKDFLEENVDKKYYLNERALLGRINTKFNSNSINGAMCKDICPTLCARDYKDPKLITMPLAIDEQNKKIRFDGTVGTIVTDGSSPKHNNRLLELSGRVRKLTPRECLRLMGWSDEQIDKIQQTRISATQQYKLGDNGIAVTILEAIFRQLFLLDN